MRRRGDLKVVVNVARSRASSPRTARLLQELADSFDGGDAFASDQGVLSKLKHALAVIRLAVTVRGDNAGVVLAELLELSPAGVEERDLDGGAQVLST